MGYDKLVIEVRNNKNKITVPQFWRVHSVSSDAKNTSKNCTYWPFTKISEFKNNKSGIWETKRRYKVPWHCCFTFLINTNYGVKFWLDFLESTRKRLHSKLKIDFFFTRVNNKYSKRCFAWLHQRYEIWFRRSPYFPWCSPGLPSWRKTPRELSNVIFLLIKYSRFRKVMGMFLWNYQVRQN